MHLVMPGDFRATVVASSEMLCLGFDLSSRNSLNLLISPWTMASYKIICILCDIILRVLYKNTNNITILT